MAYLLQSYISLSLEPASYQPGLITSRSFPLLPKLLCPSLCFSWLSDCEYQVAFPEASLPMANLGSALSGGWRHLS